MPPVSKRIKYKVEHVLPLLDEYYPTMDKCYLHYTKPFESFAQADLAEMEQDIRTTGFFRNKAKNIILCTRALLERFNGELPSDIESLTSLAGVGRKTANVVRTHIFHIPSIVVDTHVKRISGKLGITKETDPVKVELDLMKKLPEDHWILWNIHIIRLGRTICKAPTPKCEECFLKDL